MLEGPKKSQREDPNEQTDHAEFENADMARAHNAVVRQKIERQQAEIDHINDKLSKAPEEMELKIQHDAAAHRMTALKNELAKSDKELVNMGRREMALEEELDALEAQEKKLLH